MMAQRQLIEALLLCKGEKALSSVPCAEEASRLSAVRTFIERSM